MRSKRLILNTFMSIVEEIVSIISALIIPRFILSSFGSAYNGLTASITQFLSVAVLLRSGVGGATKAALYKPIANNDKDKINSIMSATDIYMKKISIILVLVIIIFAAIYPFFVISDFNWFFTFSLFIIIGISTFVSSFIGLTNVMFLQANQQNYIISISNILCTIINIIISVILLLLGKSIHIVKLGSTFAFALGPIFLNLYVMKKHKINKKVQPDNMAIAQRWDAFWHQVAIFVNNNTDIMVLTIFTNVYEVSVYSVYGLVVSGLRRFVLAFTNSIESTFGSLLAKKDKKTLNKNLEIIELIIFNISTFIYTCAIILILDFVRIYTKGISDVNYLRPWFAYIILAGEFFYIIRRPYNLIVNAAGHFKQTKKYAIVEAVLNIVISVILVIKCGLVGVAIGTLIALIYKTIMFSNYVSKNIINRSIFITYKKCFISIVEFLIILFIIRNLNLSFKVNYLNWIFNGFITASISLIVISIGIALFYREEFKGFMVKIKNLSFNKNKGNKR